jgi:hypothetical protein
VDRDGAWVVCMHSVDYEPSGAAGVGGRRSLSDVNGNVTGGTNATIEFGIEKSEVGCRGGGGQVRVPARCTSAVSGLVFSWSRGSRRAGGNRVYWSGAVRLGAVRNGSPGSFLFHHLFRPSKE